jgi:hypothetical protein
MKPHRLAVRTLAAMSTAALSLAGFAACEAQSGPNTAALVELYTSEGCSSCPPADQEINRLRQALDPAAEVVPLALHVGYWDYIGWRDPYAQARFGERQGWLVHANRQRTVYTPQFFVAGSELRAWRGALRDEVQRVNAQPARARIKVHASLAASGALALSAEATAQTASDPIALYLVLAESGLESQVMRGENAGATLAHDHVVREWIGPIPFKGGAARVRREIALHADWNRARLELAAFVQDERTGTVLQAVGARQCAGS